MMNNGPTTPSPVPYLRTRIIEQLQAHVVPNVRQFRGQVPLPPTFSTIDLAHELSVAHGPVVAGMWSLQKMGVVTFQERKGAGANGGLVRIRIAADLPRVEDVVKLAADHFEAEDVAAEILGERPAPYTLEVEPAEEPAPVIRHADPSRFPAVYELLTRELKRAKAEAAAQMLESIGLDEQAYNVLTVFPSITPLEGEVLDIVRLLGWKPPER
jgi:hypothetical protein